MSVRLRQAEVQSHRFSCTSCKSLEDSSDKMTFIAAADRSSNSRNQEYDIRDQKSGPASKPECHREDKKISCQQVNRRSKPQRYSSYLCQ